MGQFLSTNEVLLAHETQIKLYGGSTGIRDMGLLESALAMPQATFGGQFLHSSVYEMAAAYLFHIVSNLLLWMVTNEQEQRRHLRFSI
ncbi:hypothetical protein FACS1894170_13420 [Planctomycetales bacterium]|nr:hypothetical protein FACS1894170_13420 [Planctomycetales bacterium]